jgi:hypothetical protein
MTASPPKLLPFTVTMKGTLLTGTLSGLSAMIEGGLSTITIERGSFLAGFPHPRASRLTSKRPMYRIITSCKLRKMPTRQKNYDRQYAESLSFREVLVKMKEFALGSKGHCGAGFERSGTVILAYDLIAAKKKNVNNPWFTTRLRQRCCDRAKAYVSNSKWTLSQNRIRPSHTFPRLYSF